MPVVLRVSGSMRSTGHLFEHPLTIDFLGRDDFKAFCKAAVQVVSFDAAKAILVAAGIPLLSAVEEYA